MAVGAAPRVTVVVPVWNGERFIAESLDSVLAQDYPNLEVIVMDDASTDGTARILSTFGNQVNVHRQPRNKGIYENMNDGIALATGTYVAVYHADDVYEPNIVHREVTFLEQHPSVGGVFASDVFIDPEGRELGRLHLPSTIPTDVPMSYPEVLEALLRHKNPFLRCPSAMIRASAYAEVGGYRPDLYANTSDLDLYLRLARHHDLAVLGDHLFRYRRGHGSSSERYHLLRTDPSRFFAIMDAYLQEGGSDLVSPGALRAFEAHRAEDWLLIAVNQYVLGDMPAVATSLRRAPLRRLLGSSAVQRWRLSLLRLALGVLVRLPRSARVAEAFRARWAPSPAGA